MNHIIKVLSITLVSLISATAMACPKGTTLQGGTGPNHKGGKCMTTPAHSNAQHKTTAKKATHPAMTHTAQTAAVKPSAKPNTTPAATHPAAHASTAKPQAKS